MKKFNKIMDISINEYLNKLLRLDEEEVISETFRKLDDNNLKSFQEKRLQIQNLRDILQGQLSNIIWLFAF